jgi:4-amino-4-deoxy-L-arabinose transferase-like glycosyltransferase
MVQQVFAHVRQRLDFVFLFVLVAAALLRIHVATTVEYVHDEINTAIALARLISFDPDHLNLPLRAVNHGALPAYLVKIGSAIAATDTPLAYRWAHIACGLTIVCLAYALVVRRYGRTAARWAAALLAFNEYFVVMSARATAHIPYLLGAAAALYLFARFLTTQRAVFLYLSAAAVAAAFFCKEHAVLLLGACGLMLLRRDQRSWLTTAHPYAAAALFAVCIAPDIAWNIRADPAVDRVTYGQRDATPQATYARHLQRVGGVRFSAYPLAFYGRSVVRAAYPLVTGGAFDDNTREYQAMNPAIGLILLAGVAATMARVRRLDVVARCLLVYFGLVFGLFSLIKPGSPEGLDPVSWIWVDATAIPAAALTGIWLSEVAGWQRAAMWMAAAAAMAFAAVSIYSLR